jgi:hypothetical protein
MFLKKEMRDKILGEYNLLTGKKATIKALAEDVPMSYGYLRSVFIGNNISTEKAERIAYLLYLPLEDVFDKTRGVEWTITN